MIAYENKRLVRKFTGDQLIIINSELQSFTDIYGVSRENKNTQLLPYSVFEEIYIFFM
jgi:putative membrane protein